MHNNSVRTALLKRRVTLGIWIQIGHPAVAEVLANAGFDWIAVDMEHTDIDNAGFAALARAMQGHGVTPLARVRENNTLAIRQVLDLGAGYDRALESRGHAGGCRLRTANAKGWWFSRRAQRPCGKISKNPNPCVKRIFYSWWAKNRLPVLMDLYLRWKNWIPADAKTGGRSWFFNLN